MIRSSSAVVSSRKLDVGDRGLGASAAAYFTSRRFSGYRIAIEIRWLPGRSPQPAIPTSSFLEGHDAELERIIPCSPRRTQHSVKAIEVETNHDVKAVEYWLKKGLAGNPEGARVAGFVHFACTSEDINNLAYA